MILIIFNTTGSPLSYAQGAVVVPALGNYLVPEDLRFETIDDPKFLADIANGIAELDDGARHYAGTDATKFANDLVGVKDSDGKGITSTQVVTGVEVHQALDVNIVSGTSTGSPDTSTFTYGDSVFQTVGGVYNDLGVSLPPGVQAAVRITENRALHVNLRDHNDNQYTPLNPLTIKPIDPILTTSYDEVLSVIQGVTTLIATFVAGENRKLQKVDFSGTNVAEYELVINGATVDKKRTHFGFLNGTFDFDSGLALIPGQVVQVYVVHNRNMIGDFNCRCQILGA